ncbi:photosynthetic reaction center H subunit [Roseiarcus fermentans]|uniref:Photosynthetic reaction center H subunit n=1 Tax=Roseiarcus fermentans TaxID=1473586 RepID=A0A366F9P5_9HYPH|nr:photosynthetic reaction center subunit H [Roseiarcus fermentans]RBP11337.1 photosynthetic reaction center H subunit [Roseiarcus fermentans]
MRGELTAHMDVAQVVFGAFMLWFVGLVFWLRREDRREGYPLEAEVSGHFKARNVIWIPEPKTFLRADGSKVLAPNYKGDERPINARKAEPWPGAPLTPTGDPLSAGVGPGSYAARADEPYKTADGHDLLAPLRVATNYAVPAEGANPVGYEVVGADRAPVGRIKDLWVDRAESVLRYYEVALATGASVLLPVHFADVSARQRRITVNALTGAQFAGVPTTRTPDRVTLAEEDKISAYYGAGTLYATPDRVEPFL